MKNNKNSIHIVIDASVAHASGSTSSHPTSKHCREAMFAIKDASMIAIFSPELKVEWDRHASSFSRSWLVSMVARRLFTYVTPHPINEHFRKKIKKNAANEKDANAMLKDAHLIELCHVSGKRIAALDDTVRNLFLNISSSCIEVSTVMWINPAKDGQPALVWLRDCAPVSKDKFLCA